jgi:regulatory protein
MGGTISALIVQKKNKHRVNVYLDGKFAFGLAAIEAIKLRRGQALSDEDIAALKARDDIEKARQQAAGFLEYRPRSEEEVRRYLSGKGYPSETIEPVIARLTDVGLLDDRAFVRFWLDNRSEFRPRGARALRQELYQKGVPDDIIAEVLEEEHDEEEAAYRAAVAGARRWRELDAPSFREKVATFLIRRGFSYEVAREATARVWQEITHQNDDSFHEL